MDVGPGAPPEAAAPSPPPPRAPGVSYRRLSAPSDLLLSITFLGITLLGLLFVFIILVIWLRSHWNEPDRTPKKLHSKPLDSVVIVDLTESAKIVNDDFKFKLPTILNDDVKQDVIPTSPVLLKMKKSGGSSPKVPGEEQEPPEDSSDASTPASANRARTKFVFPPEDGAGTSKGKAETPPKKFKMPVPEQQWILHHKPPLDWRGYNIGMAKPFAGLPRCDLTADSAGGSREKKYSATRSPSLEKDDKSPFVVSGGEEFVFDPADRKAESLDCESGNVSPVMEFRVQPVATDNYRACSFDANETSNANSTKTRCLTKSQSLNHSEHKSVLGRRFGTSNSVLLINTVNSNQSAAEKNELQNSPRLSDQTDKENNPSPRFSYSPKFFSPSCKSPKFFSQSQEQRSPNYYSENRSRNSSPKSFDRQLSPRFSTNSGSYKSIQSPLIMDNATNEYFKFDKADDLNDSCRLSSTDETDNVFLRNKSFEETETLVIDPAPTVTSTFVDDVNENRLMQTSLDVEDSCHLNDGALTRRNRPVLSRQNSSRNDPDSPDEHWNKTDNLNVDTENQERPSLAASNMRDESQDSLSIPNTSVNTANYRRQRLKSISLDSDNAKFIEQNLGIPIVKHLRHENLYDALQSSEDDNQAGNSYQDEAAGDAPQIRSLGKGTYFNFDPTNDEYSRYENGNDEKLERSSPETQSPIKFHNPAPIAFNEMQPRFSPKEFEEAKTTKASKNIRNLTIDINRKDSDLERELLEDGCLDSASEKQRMTPKTPTLKIKATSLDSSETLNLSLPQNNTLLVPQNSISVPNTPKRQMKRALSQKSGKLMKTYHYNQGNLSENQQRKFLLSVNKCSGNFIDSGIFLRENHANLMLFQASKYPLSRGINSNASNFSRRMGSFDENMVDLTESGKSDAACGSSKEFTENRLSLPQKTMDGNFLGSTLMNFKQNLSVSSTNLKTLPEGVPSNDFDTTEPDGKSSKRTLLQRRGSNQSLTLNLDGNLKYSTLSLQGSNLSLASFGASSHNLTNIKNSASNFSLNTDNRQKKNILERRNSNTSLTLNLDGSQHGRLCLATASNCNLQGSHYNLANSENQNVQTKKCLLQRRGSNTSLTLNLQGSNLSRCTSNSSLNIHNDVKVGQKKGLLERRSSNTSLTLNINAGNNAQFDPNRVLSVSNYNLENSGAGLSRYNSNQSINNTGEHKKGLLERRSSNTSLTLNLNSSNYNLQACAVELPRDIEIDEKQLQSNIKTLDTYKDGGETSHASQQKEKHRKSLSTENLFPKSYKSRTFHCKNSDDVYSFGSHDNLWSNSYATESMDNFELPGAQNLTYIYGDQENEMIYAFGDRQHMETAGFEPPPPVRNITTKPLSPHSTSEDFKMYLANIQHLQNASNILSRKQLKDLNTIFQDGYTKSVQDQSVKKSPIDMLNLHLTHLKLDKDATDDMEGEDNPQRRLPDPELERAEYQKMLLRSLHQEFWDLPTNFQEKAMVFGSQPKNRYKTILPNEHSRVILRAQLGETEEGYINANYIKGHEYSNNCYIATQGPLPNTMYDFWLMVYQNGQFQADGCTKTNEDRHFGSPRARGKVNKPQPVPGAQKIVMLTNLVENGRQKCEGYFPLEVNQIMVFRQLPHSGYSSCSSGGGNFFTQTGNTQLDYDVNSFTVKNVGILNKTGYMVRKLEVEYRNKLLKCLNKRTRDEFGESDYFSEGFKVVIDEPSEEAPREHADLPRNTRLLDKNQGDTGNHKFVVYHYWFDNWGDHKCPQDVTALLNLSLDVLQSGQADYDEEFKKLTEKDSFDVRGEVPRERRLSAFQLAKAFFDEAAKSSEGFVKSGVRKNSLASKLDLPKVRHETTVRRESTGKIELLARQIVMKSNLNDDLEKPIKNFTIFKSQPINIPISNQQLREDVLDFKSSKLEQSTSVAKQKNISLKIDDGKDAPPIIVHCSAGIGRTGCLIAILNGIRQLRVDHRVDILGIVCNMRLNRGGMVQNSEQYELIHKVLCLYADKWMTASDDNPND